MSLLSLGIINRRTTNGRSNVVNISRTTSTNREQFSEMSEQSRGRSDAKRSGGALRTGGRNQSKTGSIANVMVKRKPEVGKVRTEQFVLV